MSRSLRASVRVPRVVLEDLKVAAEAAGCPQTALLRARLRSVLEAIDYGGTPPPVPARYQSPCDAVATLPSAELGRRVRAAAGRAGVSQGALVTAAVAGAAPAA